VPVVLVHFRSLLWPVLVSLKILVFLVRFILPVFVLPVEKLPFCLRVLLEQCVRKCDGVQVTSADVGSITHWQSHANSTVPFCPARVLFQDFT